MELCYRVCVHLALNSDGIQVFESSVGARHCLHGSHERTGFGDVNLGMIYQREHFYALNGPEA